MDNHQSLNQMARSATLHCLTGCAIGEVSGLVIGTWLGLSNIATIALAVLLAFMFGFGLSTIPLLRAGLLFAAAFPVVLAADTLSITTMEIVDNLVMLAFPGAMGEGLMNPLFWVALALSLVAAFWAAYPVNRYLLQKNKGHALVMKYHHGHTGGHHHGH